MSSLAKFPVLDFVSIGCNTLKTCELMINMVYALSVFMLPDQIPPRG
jgi:hypothetical protein